MPLDETDQHPSEGNQAASTSQALGSLFRTAKGGFALLESLADELNEAIFVVNRNQNILLFNRRAEELTGFSRDQVLGRHCLSGIRCGDCLEACGVFEGKKVRDVELELFRSDGSTLKIVKTASVLRDEEGREVGAVEIFKERLDESDSPTDGSAVSASPPPSRRLELLMDSLGRSFLLLDEELRVSHASDTMAEVLGVRADTLVGQPAADVLGDELFAPDSPFREALASGKRQEGWRALAAQADGTTRVLSVTGAPLLEGFRCDGPGGHRGRYIVVARPEVETDQPATHADDTSEFEGMVARSQAMLRVFHLIEQLRANDASVLITGESGTGKELVARAIHARSARANRPFVAVNCGALPPDLLESELFGHARGSFTGAVRDTAGRFEVAEDGTIFLDEIGDMPVALQVKLLRVLQEKTFERVGETRSRPFRARVVAATNQDLVRLALEKQFRQDLFYRLNVVPIHLPPIRDRREDLDVLITHLMEKIGRRRLRARRLSPSAMRALLTYSWPGNVRQLENALEYATAVCEGQTIHKEDLPAEVTSGAPHASEASPRDSEQVAVAGDRRQAPESDATERALPDALEHYPTARDILDALEKCRYRRGRAAALLGVSRTTLWRRMREEGLSGRAAKS